MTGVDWNHSATGGLMKSSEAGTVYRDLDALQMMSNDGK
jgi:hypothetical protein